MVGITKKVRGGDKQAAFDLALMEKLVPHLAEGHMARSITTLTQDEQARLPYLQLLTSKPILYVCNVAEDEIAIGNAHTQAVAERAASIGASHVIISAAIEAEISNLDEDDAGEFLSDLGLTESGLDRMIRAGYGLLNLLTFFTVGPKEARAWTVRDGASAPEAAGFIHTDFQRGFIRAETIAYDDYIQGQGEAGAKEAGKLRIEGADYPVKDGDVFHFRFNV